MEIVVKSSDVQDYLRETESPLRGIWAEAFETPDEFTYYFGLVFRNKRLFWQIERVERKIKFNTYTK